jgi:predicted DNA-binding transcriptional regulator YafY
LKGSALLKGFADNVEVLEPHDLRRECAEMAESLAIKYAKKAGKRK